jgi:hypothetical protein
MPAGDSVPPLATVERSIPPPVPEEAFAAGDKESAGGDEPAAEESEAGDEEEPPSPLQAIYIPMKEQKRIDDRDFEDLSLKLDPDRLPSLAPLPLPEPEKGSPALGIVIISLVVVAAGAGGWFWWSGSSEDDLLEEATAQQIAPEVPAAPAAAAPGPKEAAPAPEPEESVTYEFSVDELAALEPGAAASSEPSGSEKTAPARSGKKAASAQKPAGRSPAGADDVSARKTPAGAALAAAQGKKGAGAAKSRSSGGAKKPGAAAPEPPPLGSKEKLDREDIARGMAAIRGDVKACSPARHGIAKVRVTIAGSGRVRSTLVTGVFQGTPEGSCIARTVRKARFPSFNGPPVTVDFPFSL